MPKLAPISLLLPNGSHNEIKVLDETLVVLCHAIKNLNFLRCFQCRHVNNS
jgi:hypothetical protein